MQKSKVGECKALAAIGTAIYLSIYLIVSLCFCSRCIVMCVCVCESIRVVKCCCRVKRYFIVKSLLIEMKMGFMTYSQ